MSSQTATENTMSNNQALKVPIDWSTAARELAIIAFIGLGLTFPLIAYKTVDSQGGITLDSRWTSALLGIALLIAGRFGLILLRHGHALMVMIAAVVVVILGFFIAMPTAFLQFLPIAGGGIVAIKAAIRLWINRSGVTQAQLAHRNDHLTVLFQNALPIITIVAVVITLIIPLFANRYWLEVLILIFTYVMLGWGLNIIVGYAGLLDLGYVAFYAVGAYSYALAAHYLGVSFWLAMPIAGILAATFGLLLGFPVLRLRGDYFAIVTLGFGEIIRIILLNWTPVTNGPNGISGIPRPSFFGLATFSRKERDGLVPFHELFHIDYSTLNRIVFFYYLLVLLCLFVAFINVRVRRLPLGRAWEALREDDIACASLGINRTKIKLSAFALAASMAGIAGSFFATRQGFISPESFTFIESAVILAIVVLGGMGNLFGIAIAAAVLIGLPEVFRELSEYRMLAFGAGLVFIMNWRPQGLISHREPTARLHAKTSLFRHKKA